MMLLPRCPLQVRLVGEPQVSDITLLINGKIVRAQNADTAADGAEEKPHTLGDAYMPAPRGWGHYDV